MGGDLTAAVESGSVNLAPNTVGNQFFAGFPFAESVRADVEASGKRFTGHPEDLAGILELSWTHAVSGGVHGVFLSRVILVW
jgi:hypothetical protein